MPEQPPLEIRRAAGERTMECLRLLVGRSSAELARAHAALLLTEARSSGERLEGLLEARRGERLVGVVWVRPQAGRVAALWPPRLIADEPPQTAALLIEAAVDWAAEQDLRMAQALVEETAAAEEIRALEAGGFRRLAELIYMVSFAEVFPDAPPAHGFVFEPYTPAAHGRFAEVVERTYEGSRDCPGLEGVRDVEDVLAGYRATGSFDPQRWLIVRRDQRDIGCLILTEHAPAGQWELVYFGLVPEARGQGYGIELVRHAQWLARQAGSGQLALAVDAENEPALRIYRAAGFRPWERREVFLKVL